MFVKIAIIAILLLIVLVAIIASRPSSFEITRSAVIPAPPSEVFPHINDFRRWEVWSPWAKLDPDAESTFEGPPTGPGATFGWSGDRSVGEGRNTVVESVPDERIRIKLEFVRPFAATNDVRFIFVPEAGGTRVTWTMSGRNNFMGKAVGLIMDCEKMVGGQFEQGLANLADAVAKDRGGNIAGTP